MAPAHLARCCWNHRAHRTPPWVSGRLGDMRLHFVSAEGAQGLHVDIAHARWSARLQPSSFVLGLELANDVVLPRVPRIDLKVTPNSLAMFCAAS